MLQNPQRGRLAAELEDLSTVVAELAAPGDPATTEAVRQASAWRARAADALGRRDVDAGWHFAFRAREALIPTWDAVRLQTEAQGLRTEVATSDKFSTWRKAAILEQVDEVLRLLTARLEHGEPERQALDARAHLLAASRVRNEQHENEYRRLSILRRHQVFLLLLGSPFLILVLSLLVAGPMAPGPAAGRSSGWLVLTATAIGVVGAVVSAVQRSTRLRADRIPQQLGSGLASFSRVPLGAVAGLTAFLAVDATGNGVSASYVLLVAFGAGFSERLVTATKSPGERPVDP